MSNLNGKNILVIGASGAFGSEFALQLIQSGAIVSGTAKNAETSIKLRADLHSRLLLDLENQENIQNFADYLNGQAVAIDGIVLAAGLVAFGNAQETPLHITNRLMQVNALGQIHLVQALLPKLTKSATEGREPFVLSISGIISEQPLAGLASYSASKTALAGYAKAASKEFRKLGISWIDARPGHTESGLANRAIYGTSPNFGTGMSVTHVVTRMLQAIKNNETDLHSSQFGGANA